MPAASFVVDAELTISSDQARVRGDDLIGDYLESIAIEAFRRIDVKVTTETIIS